LNQVAALVRTHPTADQASLAFGSLTRWSVDQR